ncbi:MAG: HAMP domain-containing protein, partial [Candidatus Paceibacterota bacterium]
MKLSVKILLIFIFSAFIVVATAGVVVFEFTKSNLKKVIGVSQLQLTESVMNKIDRVMLGAYRDIQIIAGIDNFEDFLENGEIGNSVSVLKEASLFTGPWDRLLLMDTKALTVLSTDDEIGMGSVFMEAHQATMRGEVFVSDVLISPVTNKPTVIFAAPIFDQRISGRNIVGMVRGEFAWQVVIEILEELDIADVILVNANGVGIAEGRGHYINIREGLISKMVIADASYTDPGNHYGIHEKGLTLEEEVLTSVAIQKGHLEYKGKGWFLVLDTVTANAFAFAREEGLELAFIMAILVVLAFSIIYLLIQFLVIKPVTKLSAVSIAIAGGDIKKRAEVKSKDEIGKLAISFNKMTDNLAESYRELEKKVEARTKELEQANKMMMGRESRIADLKEENQK